MKFLSPWHIPALAASLTIVPLVLLYFLKLKRRELAISSTLLWRRAVEDLQVNAPFQKLRKNLLLLLQLLVLLAGIVALAEPMWSGARSREEPIVLMLDQSASMSVVEADGRSRLEIAREQARQIVDDLSSGQKAMVITFADRARVLTTFTDNKADLRRVIDDVRQLDAPGRLSEAMALAEAHSAPGAGQETEVPLSQYIVLTDGRLPDAADVAIKRGEMEMVRVGRRQDNAGIVDLDVRRFYEQPEQVSVLARVRNFGSEPINRDLMLFVDGELSAVRELGRLEPLGDVERLETMTLGAVPPEGNESIAAFELPMPSAGRIEVRLSGEDAMPTDDRAFAVVSAPRSINVLLVTPGNQFLRRLLPSMPVNTVDIWSPQEYEQAPVEKLMVDGRCAYDVVIFDGYSTERLPPGNYFFFAGVPMIEGVEMGARIKNKVFLDWDNSHPILRHVNVENINVFNWHDLILPREARTLIEGPNGPVLSLLLQGRNQYLICAFGLFNEDRTYLNTDWVLDRGFVVFMYNALRFLAGTTTGNDQSPVQPGQPFTVAAKPGTRTLEVRRPDGQTDEVEVSPGGLATYGRTDRVGIYGVSTDIAGQDERAVNLTDEQESFIAPNREFRVAAGDLTATAGVDRTNQPLWPFFLMLLGGFLLIEWIIYNKRIYV